VIITTSDGKKSEAYIPVDTSVSISGFDRTNKTVKSIAISGDATATFFVGDISIVNDSTPITGDVNTHDLNLAQGDEFEFTASGSGGSTPLKYTWDFDASDGIQVDAEGRSVTRKFRKPGNYIITLTISDLYGLKTPYTTTIKAVVNP
jgi:PKD repeat protein